MRKLMCCLTSVMVVVMLLGFSVGVVQAGKCELPDFDATNFGGTPEYNAYFPMAVLGNVYVYEAEEDDELIRNYIYFSYDTVPIAGVTCYVVYDVEWIWVQELLGGAGDWRKLEETEDWHTWDDDGNYWYFGEWTTEYEYNDNWDLTGSNNDGSWTAGVDGAEPGIIMPINPKQGDCYFQEYYEDEAEDVGKILRLNARCEDSDGTESEECMVMKEWTALEPGNVEHKIYFPGEGLVYIKELKEKTVEVELVGIVSPPIPDPPAPLP